MANVGRRNFNSSPKNLDENMSFVNSSTSSRDTDSNNIMNINEIQDNHLVSANAYQSIFEQIPVLGFVVSSSLLLISNKFLVSKLRTPAFIIMFQLILTVITTRAMGAARIIQINPVDTTKLKQFLIVPLIFMSTLFANMKILEHSNVQTFIVFRAVATVFVSLLDVLYMERDLPNWRSTCSMVLVIAASIMYLRTSNGQLFVDSMFWVFVWVICFCCDQIFIKRIVETVHMSTWSRVFYTNLIPIPILMCVSYSLGEINDLIPKMMNTSMVAWLLIITSLVSVANSFFAFRCRQLISATAFTVVGNFSKAITVTLTLLLWPDNTSSGELVSLACCIVGGFFYQQASKGKVEPHKRQLAKLVLVAAVIIYISFVYWVLQEKRDVDVKDHSLLRSDLFDDQLMPDRIEGVHSNYLKQSMSRQPVWWNFRRNVTLAPKETLSKPKSHEFSTAIFLSCAKVSEMYLLCSNRHSLANPSSSDVAFYDASTMERVSAFHENLIPIDNARLVVIGSYLFAANHHKNMLSLVKLTVNLALDESQQVTVGKLMNLNIAGENAIPFEHRQRVFAIDLGNLILYDLGGVESLVTEAFQKPQSWKAEKPLNLENSEGIPGSIRGGSNVFRNSKGEVCGFGQANEYDVSQDTCCSSETGETYLRHRPFLWCWNEDSNTVDLTSVRHEWQHWMVDPCSVWKHNHSYYISTAETDEGWDHTRCSVDGCHVSNNVYQIDLVDLEISRIPFGIEE